MKYEPSKRVQTLPPYIFVQIDEKKRALASQGKDIIDLGVGDPDLPTPRPIVDALSRGLEHHEYFRYSLGKGLPELRQAIARWHRKNFGVLLDPETEILPLIGSKEGIGHLPTAIINPDDVVLIPEPSYPPYTSGTIFAGGEPYVLPLHESNGFLPDIESIPLGVVKRARMIWVNYPNNPTSAVAPRRFYEDLIRFAGRNGILVCQDAAYISLYYEKRPISILEVPGAKEVGVEFFSFSKTYSMAGWRMGWVAGNASVIAALAKVKANLDSGIFIPIQHSGIAALLECDDEVARLVSTYRQRRDTFVNGLRKGGLDVPLPQATFYVWMHVPPGLRSFDFCERLLTEAQVVMTPGAGFGTAGEGFARAALTIDNARISEAVERILKFWDGLNQ